MSDREIDQELVERAQRGDKQAFGLLVEKYQRKLARLLSRFVRDPAEVEDVTQEAFIKAYRALPKFRGDSAFYTWLYRIGINTAKNYLMAAGRRAPAAIWPACSILNSTVRRINTKPANGPAAAAASNSRKTSTKLCNA